MTPALVFVLATATAYRATRLITTDSLFDTWRNRLFLRFPPNRQWACTEWADDAQVYVQHSTAFRRYPRKLGQLFDCPWCVGFWIAGITWGLTWHFYPLVLPGLWWPAMSAGIGALATMLER